MQLSVCYAVEMGASDGGTRCPQRVEGLSLRAKRLEANPLRLQLHDPDYFHDAS
jgi:hypothetical protein